MKVVIVNFTDIKGGAGRAAYRLHRSLLNENIESKMLVQEKYSDDFTVISPKTNFDKFLTKFQVIINNLPLIPYINKSPFSPSFSPSFNIVKRINKLNPDIVHLHWINAGMLNVKDLSKIKAPIVWSLHDNWPFTGGCHITWECEKYKNNCGSCPRLESQKDNDLSRKIWNKKLKYFQKIKKLTIVGLSNWIYECSQKSSLFKNKRHVNIPNPININTFKPIEKVEARQLWNLQKSKKLILFGAVNATNDINKGLNKLCEALSKLEDNNIELIIFGVSKPKEPQNFGFRTHYLGRLYDDVSLVTLYNAADILVVPSLQENLSNAIMESLACATPVVGFDVGGNSDMIEHKKTGYLAKPFDTTGLAYGIEWVLNSPNYNKLCLNARNKVLREFDSNLVAQKYIKLYYNNLNDKN